MRTVFIMLVADAERSFRCAQPGRKLWLFKRESPVILYNLCRQAKGKQSSTCSNKGRFHQIKFRHHGMRILMGLIQAFDMEVRETNMILQKAQAKMTIACTGFERQTEKLLTIY